MNNILGWILRQHRGIHVVGELSVFVITFFGAVMIFNVPAIAATITLDPLETRISTEMSWFTGWLAANNAKGYIGEVGWPDNTGGDAVPWNALANVWYQDADKANLWVTVWGAGSWWGTTYKLSPYQDKQSGGGVNSPNSQAAVLEAHPPTASYQRGVNVSGGEFGTGGTFRNTNPGTYGTNYFFDPTATFAYLGGRGENVIRLPFRWERIQHTLGGPLDAPELQRLTDAVNRAGASGLGVILDLHNYGEYQTAAGRQTIGQGVSSANLNNLWMQLSQAFKNNPAVTAYDIMNEPHDLGGANPAKTWEQASQSALSTIRDNGDSKLIMIPGYNWSGVASWKQTHPATWISDPSNNFRYEAHHYWDRDSSGVYASSYASEVANAVGRGYAASTISQNPTAIAASNAAKSTNGAAGGTTTPPPSVSTKPATGSTKTTPIPTASPTASNKSDTSAAATSPDKTPTAHLSEILVKSSHGLMSVSVTALVLAALALLILEIKLRLSPKTHYFRQEL